MNKQEIQFWIYTWTISPQILCQLFQFFKISRILSVIIIYEEGETVKYRVLPSLNFTPHLNYAALE